MTLVLGGEALKQAGQQFAAALRRSEPDLRVVRLNVRERPT